MAIDVVELCGAELFPQISIVEMLTISLSCKALSSEEVHKEVMGAL